MKFKYLFLLIGLSVFSCTKEQANTPTNEAGLDEKELQILQALEQELHPISTAVLEIPDDDLQTLDRFSNTKIVGLGEATHGTREFFEMKHRVFQYLVENHGYDAFVFEMDMGEALIFDSWIQGGDSRSIAGLMRDHMYFWTWRTEEVKELFIWMRDYNEKQVESSKIHLVGVDSQTGNYDADALAGLLQGIDPQLADSVRTLNRAYRNNIRQLYEKQNQADADMVNAGIASTLALLEREKDRIIAASSEKNFLWMERLAVHMQQTATYTYEAAFESNYRLRDQFMAENTDWFFELLGSDAQLVLWAHNGHVAKNQTYGATPSQGGHLHNRHGADYQVIGFGFSSGRFTAFGGGNLRTHTVAEIPDAERRSFNFILNRAGSANFMLDLDNVQDPVLKSWLQGGRRFLQLGSVFEPPVTNYYRVTPITQYFNFLIYFDATSNSVLL